MLGATVVMDVVVVSTFSIALTLSKALLGGELSLSELAASVARRTRPRGRRGSARRARVEVLAWSGFDRTRWWGCSSSLLAALAAWLAGAFKGWAHTTFGIEVEIEPLLVAMIAGLFVANLVSKPARFAGYSGAWRLGSTSCSSRSPGSDFTSRRSSRLRVPRSVLWALRVSGLWVGSTAAMAAAKEPALVRRIAWRAFVPQAGIALALASTIAAEFPQGGPMLASVIIGTIVINEATGPLFLRSALRAAGETVPEGEVLD